MIGLQQPKAPQDSHLLKGFVDGRFTYQVNLMSNLLKRLFGAIALLDRLRPNIPLRGRIRASLVWDFRTEQ